MEVLAKRLRQRARELGLSDAEVARRAGLEPPSYGHYVTGNRRPTYKILLRLCAVLTTSPNYLLGFNDDAGLPPDMARLLTAFNGLDAEGRELAAALVEMLAERLAQNRASRADAALAAPATQGNRLKAP